MKRYYLFLCAVTLASSAFAAQNTLDTGYEYGRKGSSGLVEEEDLTDEFDYAKYTIKYGCDIDKLTSCNIRYQYYNKDFDTLQGLDNNFNSAWLGFEREFHNEDGFSVKIGPDFEFKDKRYQDSRNLDYDQIVFNLPFTFKEEKDWAIMLNNGINYYEYPGAPKDEFKVFSRLDVSKKFFDDRLDVSAFYKFQYVGRQKLADRYERNFGASADMKVDSSVIKNLEAGFERGMDNTKSYEEREDAYDFKYASWYLKTRAALGDTLKTSLKYSPSTRQYADFNHNHDGFSFENNWSACAFEKDDYSLNLKFNYLHRQFRYPYAASPFAFHLNAISPEAEFGKKGDWKASAGSEIKFYDYPARRTNDKIYYIAKASIEKSFLKRSLAIGIDYKYTFKNFLHKLDITEHVLKLRATCKF